MEKFNDIWVFIEMSENAPEIASALNYLPRHPNWRKKPAFRQFL